MIKTIQEDFDSADLFIKKLNGYDNENYLVDNKHIKRIYKTYNFNKNLYDFVTAEIHTLKFLQDTFKLKIPQPIPFRNGTYTKIAEVNNTKKICRILSYLDGDLLGEIKHSKKLFKSIGIFLAEMDLTLKNYTNYTIQARKHQWDLQYFHLNKKLISAIPNAKDRSIVSYFFQQFEVNVSPIFPELRKQIIHNDANEWNILVKNDEISGIIDFGDLTFTPLINQIAIAIAYCCYDKDKPLEWAVLLLKAYHSKLPILEKEIEILYYLIASRLVTTICNSAHEKIINPSNTYASSSEKPAWSMLYKWITINPIYAENEFRIAINLSPKVPQALSQVLKKRHKFISPILALSYEEPIHLVKSAFQYMYDSQGNTFLDAYNNIPHVGHSHPDVVSAGQIQMTTLNTNTRYLYDLLGEYAEKLLSKFPEPLNKIYFVNSGSEASDLAIRMACSHTKHKTIMVMEHGYHGHTQIGINISDYKFNNPKGQGQAEHIIKTQIPNTYNGKYTNTTDNTGEKYANDAITEIKKSNSAIAAFISEPIVGCGGQVPLADGYLKALYPEIRKQGGVCISDEVQTGFGRLGDHFWGFEAHDVIPDIVIIGKPMANGHPMGAVITTNDIASSFAKGVEFFSSFGGNPVSCAIGLSVLNVIEEEQLQEHAKAVGDYYKSLLKSLQKKFNCIGDVRGSGLFLGVEIVKLNTKDPDTKLAHLIKNELRQKHILISTDGPHNNVLKTKPPLCFTKSNAKEVTHAIDAILNAYYL